MKYIKANGLGGLRRLVRLIALSLIISGEAEITVTRPDAIGKNGGKVWKATTGYQGSGGSVGDDPDRQYVSEFSEIVGRIDAALKPLLSLPESGGINEQVENCKSIAGIVLLDPVLGGCSMYSTDIMKIPLDSIENGIDSMTSATLTAFRNKFVTNLETQ
jgi:hypothetical protein